VLSFTQMRLKCARWWLAQGSCSGAGKRGKMRLYSLLQVKVLWEATGTLYGAAQTNCSSWVLWSNLVSFCDFFLILVLYAWVQQGNLTRPQQLSLLRHGLGHLTNVTVEGISHRKLQLIESETDLQNIKPLMSPIVGLITDNTNKLDS